MENMNDLSQPATKVKCWVELYSDKMYTWALYKTGTIEVAEDLVEDTFLAAFWNYRSDGRQIDVSEATGGVWPTTTQRSEDHEGLVKFVCSYLWTWRLGGRLPCALRDIQQAHHTPDIPFTYIVLYSHPIRIDRRLRRQLPESLADVWDIFHKSRNEDTQIIPTFDFKGLTTILDGFSGESFFSSSPVDNPTGPVHERNPEIFTVTRIRYPAI